MVCLGISTNLCAVILSPSDDYNDLPPIIARAIEFARWADKLPLMAQLMMLAAFFVIFGPMVVAESLLFGPSTAPTAILGIGLLIAYYARRWKLFWLRTTRKRNEVKHNNTVYVVTNGWVYTVLESIVTNR
jgi:hypothetical protein